MVIRYDDWCMLMIIKDLLLGPETESCGDRSFYLKHLMWCSPWCKRHVPLPQTPYQLKGSGSRYAARMEQKAWTTELLNYQFYDVYINVYSAQFNEFNYIQPKSIYVNLTISISQVWSQHLLQHHLWPLSWSFWNGRLSLLKSQRWFLLCPKVIKAAG